MSVMATAAIIGFIWTSIDARGTRRQIAQQAAQERCQSATDGECQQLAVNVRAAVAAEDAADFAAQQLWLNILGLFGLGATVAFAAFAWREAQRSADAAVQAAEAIPVLERAYVFGGLDKIVRDLATGAVTFHVILNNAGKTPARVRRLQLLLVLPEVDGIVRLPAARDYSGGKSYPTDTIFAAGEKGPVLKFENKPTFGIAAGCIEYRDIFNKQHFSRFCVGWDGLNETASTIGDESWNEYD